MAGTVEQKLGTLGITLTEPRAPVANYVGFVRTGNLLIVSGQVCADADGKLATVQAAVVPPALLVSGLLLAVTFLGLRLAGRRDIRLPAGLWFATSSLTVLLLTFFHARFLP